MRDDKRRSVLVFCFVIISVFVLVMLSRVLVNKKPFLFWNGGSTNTSKVENSEVRQGLPPAGTFHGRIESEKDGVTRVQVRGLITRWMSDSIELRINNGESVHIKFPAQVQ